MQRRAATAYVALLLVVAAGSYGVIAATDAPEVTAGTDAETHANQSTFSVGDRTYTVASVTTRETEGGVTREATLAWVNESARYTDTVANGSAVTLDGTDYRVAIPNVSSPSNATLTEIQRTDLPNTTVGNTTYVVLNATGDNRTLVPEERYLREQFGPAEVLTVRVGDRFDYRGNDSAVAEISGEELVLAWEYPRRNTVTASEGSNVTLNGVRHVARFENDESVILTTQLETYQSQVDEVERFRERTNGFWGVVVLSLLGAATLGGLAFLPRKDV